MHSPMRMSAVVASPVILFCIFCMFFDSETMVYASIAALLTK